MCHTALTSGHMECERGPAGGPPQARPVGDGFVDLFHGGFSSGDHVQGFAPERFLETISNEAGDFTLHGDDRLAEVEDPITIFGLAAASISANSCCFTDSTSGALSCTKSRLFSASASSVCTVMRLHSQSCTEKFVVGYGICGGAERKTGRCPGRSAASRMA